MFVCIPVLSVDSVILQIQLAVTVHGLTRNKELIMLLKKFGLSISYDDVLNLYKAWAVHEGEEVC